MSAAPQQVRSPRFSLMVKAGPHSGERFTFDQCPIRLGRSGDNQVSLSKDLKVSRVHVEIRFQQGQFSFHNISEKNQVLVNAQNVRNTVVTSDCTLVLGDTEIAFHLEEALGLGNPPALASVNIKSGNSEALVSYREGTGSSQQKTASGFHSGVVPMPTLMSPPTSQPMEAGLPSMSGSPYVQQENSKILFYVIIGAVVCIFAFFLSGKTKSKAPLQIRTSDEVVKGLEDSKDTLEQLQKEDERLGLNSPQYLLAEQQWAKGFRDYRNGQYSRAIIELQSALAFFPQHSRARKYLTTSQRILDEQIKTIMRDGQKYKSQGNYRMCAASFEKALRMMNAERDDETTKEAKQYKEECQYELRSHY